MPIKNSNSPQSGQADTAEPQFKENAQVNARIDEFIKNNPERWKYIQSMPPERMARALVLNDVQKNARTEKMRASVLSKLDQNPEMKEHIQGLVKHLPEDQREDATVSIATRTMRALKPKETQTPGVKV